MTLTIAFGWWIAPAVITAGSFIAAMILSPKPQPDLYLPDYDAVFIRMIFYGGAWIASLASWLIWSLVS